MIQTAQSKDVISNFDRQIPIQDAQVAFGMDRRGDLAGESAADKVKQAIDSMIGRRVQELQVSIEDDCVIVTAMVPSFYVRQLVEHRSRSIVVDHLNKTFVSRVVVN